MAENTQAIFKNTMQRSAFYSYAKKAYPNNNGSLSMATYSIAFAAGLVTRQSNWSGKAICFLTDSGREFVKSQGWIVVEADTPATTPAANTETVSAKPRRMNTIALQPIAPANSEPQADVFGDDEPIIMSDADKEDLRQRFDAMRAERKATKNTQDKPANSEPQADITPADIAAVEAMGEVAANVFGEDCDEALKCEHGVNVVHCTDCYVKSERSDDELDELMREYDRKIAREEMQSLYNSDSGVDADDYRAHIDANVLNVPASDEISKQDAQPEGGLTDDERAVLVVACSDFNVTYYEIERRTGLRQNTRAVITSLLDKKLLVEHWDKYTHTAKGYSMFVALQSIDKPTAPVDGGSDGDDERTGVEKALLSSFTAEHDAKIADANNRFYTAAEEARVANQQALQGTSAIRKGIETIGNMLERRNEELDAQQRTIDHQQAEIRALESKLAAAVGALERAHKAMEVGKKALWSFADDWNEWEEYTNNTDEPSARYFISNFDDELFMRSLEEVHKAYQVLSIGAQNVKLAARGQSGADEGK